MKTALLVIDVQRGLFDGPPRPFEADAVIARINTLAQAAREAEVPVIWIQHERDGTALAHRSDGWHLAAQLDVRERDLHVRKTTPDSFLRTDLQDQLQAHNIDHVTVCGYASEFCVDTTVRRAAALGYPVTLVADAHTTHDKPHASGATIRQHENATLPEIGSFGPVIAAIAAADVAFGA